MTKASTGLDTSVLKPYKARTFVPENANPTDIDQLKSLYQKLIDYTVDSSQMLYAFLLDRSELEAAIDQSAAVLHINMTCHTDDQEKSNAYKHYIEIIAPAVREFTQTLDKKYLNLLKKFPLDPDRFYVHDREIKADVELFSPKNLPLQTQLDSLSQQYQTICGAMTVHFQNDEYTMPQMQKFLHQTDPELRKNAWKAAAQRRLDDAEKLDDIFDKMLDLRQQLAENAQCNDYRQYIFRKRHRFDYTTEDCKKFHDAVEKFAVPVLAKVYEKRKYNMSLDSLRPWDLEVDPHSKPPLKPFEDVTQLINGCIKIFIQLDPHLGVQFKQMAELKLLDLQSRKGKAPGGYQQTLSEARKPFIFANAVGLDNDLTTLLHEAGHAFHAFAAAEDPILAYRHAPIEFCEVASMSMELLASPYMQTFYSEQDAKRSVRLKLERALYILPWVATIDAFQHWIYENPKHTHSQRNQAFTDIHNRFAGQFINYQGLENFHQLQWHRQLHIFQFPFYYIEYGIAQLGALGLWLQSKKDPAHAIANYKNAIALGGSKPLPQLFNAAGLDFDFSENTIKPLIETLSEELEKLSD